MIRAENLGYSYLRYGDESEDPVAVPAVKGVDLQVEEGSFLAVLGHNGSGKSTLARHINALLLPSEGAIWIDGIRTSEEKELWRIRQRAGMVFQNPDNQIIGTVVEEDVGFGPENMGVPTEDIWKRVGEALTKTGMNAYRDRSPNRLSGGQKQRVAIAGVVAMRPKCIVLDEPTAMLDPVGRREVLEVVRELNRREHVTVILITHYMEEAACADRVCVMDRGRIVLSGTPREIFSRVEELRALHLDVPEVTEIAHILKKAGLPLPDGILTKEEFLSAMRAALPDAFGRGAADRAETAALPHCPAPAAADAPASEKADAPASAPLLELRGVKFVYGKDSAFETQALKGVDLSIGRGEFISVIGQTGSGKSTMIQLLNGLLRPSEGEVLWEGQSIFGEKFDLRALRTRVGLVFQYPEHQLFEKDVLTDVMFGPKNQGLSKEEAEEKAARALTAAGLSEDYWKESPFELSGGEKRRAAIAGVLAMEPQVLILDEPTAGLDPKGRDGILDFVKELQKTRQITIVLVTHSMEDAARYAQRLVIVHDGTVAFDGPVREAFRDAETLEKMGLALPQAAELCRTLAGEGFPVRTDAVTAEEAAESILAVCQAAGVRAGAPGEAGAGNSRDGVRNSEVPVC